MSATDHTIDVATLADDMGRLRDTRLTERHPIPDGDHVIVELVRTDDGLEPRAVRHDPDCIITPHDGYENNDMMADKIVRGTYNAEENTVTDIVVL